MPFKLIWRIMLSDFRRMMLGNFSRMMLGDFSRMMFGNFSRMVFRDFSRMVLRTSCFLSELRPTTVMLSGMLQVVLAERVLMMIYRRRGLVFMSRTCRRVGFHFQIFTR